MAAENEKKIILIIRTRIFLTIQKYC